MSSHRPDSRCGRPRKIVLGFLLLSSLNSAPLLSLCPLESLRPFVFQPSLPLQLHANINFAGLSMEKARKFYSNVSGKTIKQDILWELVLTNTDPLATMKFHGSPSQSIRLSPSNDGNWKTTFRTHLPICVVAFWNYSGDVHFTVDFWIINVSHRIYLLVSSH